MMKDNNKDKDNESLTSQEAQGKDQKKMYVLRLYIQGNTPKANRAIKNIKKICEEYLKGMYDLEIIDVHQRPDIAVGENIVALPTLVKELPRELRKLIGDLSDKERVLVGLNLLPKN